MRFDCFVPTKTKRKVLISKTGKTDVVLSCTLHASIVRTLEKSGAPLRWYQIGVLIFAEMKRGIRLK